VTDEMGTILFLIGKGILSTFKKCPFCKGNLVIMDLSISGKTKSSGLRIARHI